MTGRGIDCWRPRRQAFTLVEVMLTLCLMVIIAGLAWPVLIGGFANQRLRGAADQIRAEWVAARVEAMDSGRTYLFRYTPDDGRFCLEPHAAAESADDPVFNDSFDGASGGQGYAGGPRPAAENTLPDGVTFVASETAPDPRAALIESQSSAGDLLEVGWSEPIFFYPDGTASTARLVLRNQNDRRIQLSLRGLTGVVTIGDVYAGEER
jgi:type II secretory pathway pseudopilin PulG